MPSCPPPSLSMAKPSMTFCSSSTRISAGITRTDLPFGFVSRAIQARPQPGRFRNGLASGMGGNLRYPGRMADPRPRPLRSNSAGRKFLRPAPRRDANTAGTCAAMTTAGMPAGLGSHISSSSSSSGAWRTCSWISLPNRRALSVSWMIFSPSTCVGSTEMDRSLTTTASISATIGAANAA